MRPSELLGIHDELDRFFLDRAVTTFGMAVEADLDEASAKAKDSKKAQQARQRVLDRWLNLEPQFRDPAKEQHEPQQKKQDATKQGSVSSEQDGQVVL